MRRAKEKPQVEHRIFGTGAVINRFSLSGDAGKVLTVRFDGDHARAVLLLPQFWITGWEALLAAWETAPDRATQKTQKSAGVSDPRPQNGRKRCKQPEIVELKRKEDNKMFENEKCCVGLEQGGCFIPYDPDPFPDWPIGVQCQRPVVAMEQYGPFDHQTLPVCEKHRPLLQFFRLLCEQD